MSNTFWSALHRILNKPLFGTKVIPPGARVDPAQFSEDEFPVYCSKCRYLLRGLPDGRCPECGEPFERGKLLVIQYVRDWQRHPELRSAKYWGIGFGVTFLLVSIASGLLFQKFVVTQLPKRMTHLDAFGHEALWFLIGRGAILVAGAFIFILMYRRSKTGRAEKQIKRKRRLIKLAYFRDYPQ